jgi:hypothetical protein
MFNACCHCSICRRTSGADFLHSLGWSTKNFVLKGEENLTAFKSSESTFRKFCKVCGASVLVDIPSYEMVCTTPALYNDDVKDFKEIVMHCYYDNRVVDVMDGKTKYKTDSKGETTTDSDK